MKNTLLGVAAILLFALFIFSGTSGDLDVHGDDIWFLSRFNNGGETYWQRIAARFYLTPFYTAVYDLAGHDTARMHRIFFALQTAAGVLLFAATRRFIGFRAALLAALFYVSYVGTFEIIVWLSAGAYTVVVAAALASLWIASQTRWNPWLRGVLVAAVNWPPMHLYELAISATPLYPLLLFLWWRMRGERLQWREFLASWIPTAMFLAHWLAIYVSTTAGQAPLWMRNPGMRTDPMSLFLHACKVAWLGIGSSIGRIQAGATLYSLDVFLHIVPKTIGLAVAGIAALAAVLYAALLPPAPASDPNRRRMVLLAALAGLWLWLLSPVVGLTTVMDFVPSRLLAFSAIGLAILFGVLFEHGLPGRWTAWAAAAVLAVQAVALNGLLYENYDSWQFDSGLRRQLNTMQLRFAEHDRIFLSLPEHPRMYRFWRRSPSQFESLSVQSVLLYDAGMAVGDFELRPHARLTYLREVRSGSGPLQMPLPAPGASERGRLFPFFVTPGDYRLLAIRRAEVVNQEGDVLHVLDLPAVSGIPPQLTTQVRASAVAVANPFVDQDCEVRVHHPAPGHDLLIEGRVLRLPATLHVELRQDGRVIASAAAGASSRISLRVPLDRFDPARPLLLANRQGRSALWRIETAALTRSPKQ